MPKVTINGNEVEVKEGATIIEAFKAMEEDIAHYCWHPGLSIAGVCRLCMVEIEGMPRPQIACNTVVKEGMVITNQSESIKETVQWGLDFHLINHPLDCPICDQAGECGLQDQYMKFGKYDPEMAENKVKKRKVVDLGERVVLDTERCILCSRCVRFTDEVSETNELGIFNRGDRSEIGTFKDKPLNNKYSLNTVDICPVGALTSKDFRFKQRVWYLKNEQTVCAGCSTGCNISAYFNEEGVFRVKPVYNEEVNGYWMCDEGRDMYKYTNREVRLRVAQDSRSGEVQDQKPFEMLKTVGEDLRSYVSSNGASSVAVVLTGQNTCEEYEDLMTAFNGLGVTNIYHWKNQPEKFEEFDGLLIRGDKNPNTKGLEKAMEKHGIKTDISELKGSVGNAIKYVVVVGPENQAVYPEHADMVTSLGKADRLVWFAPNAVEGLDKVSAHTTLIPTKCFVEKSGTFINFNGLSQTFKKVVTVVPEAFNLSEVSEVLQGKSIDFGKRELAFLMRKDNHFTSHRGTPL